MDGVQEPLFDKALLEGQGSPKFQYNARGPVATRKPPKKYEKIIGKSGSQSVEKKTGCDKCDSGETTTVLLALPYQKLGCS
jgi:hypothetical protein